MRIVLLCATRRGLLVLKKLAELCPIAELVVFSFQEESWEPSFRDAIRKETFTLGGTFLEARQVGANKWKSFWDNTPIDLLLTVSWRYMIPPAVYRKAKRGAFVLHDSLLPAYRGFAPTVWAIANGEDHTGVTLFEMVENVDEGDIIDQERVPIGPDDAIPEVIERVTAVYLQLLERNLARLLDGTAPHRPQDHSHATFTCRRLPADNQISWNNSTREIFNLIRAVTAPYPGAFTSLNGKKLTVWAAKQVPSPPYVGRVPGRVVEVQPGIGSLVLTGDGVLLLTLVQIEGSQPVCAADVLNNLSMTLGH